MPLQLHAIWCEIRIPVLIQHAFEMPAFRNRARYLNSETNSASIGDRRMSSQSLIKFGLRTPREQSGESAPILKIGQ